MSRQTLAARIQYMGGNQIDRMNKQKLNSLKWALKNDYNSRMIKLSNGTATRCLINTSKLTADFDKKYISIPFDSQLQAGDTFECLDDNTHWLVYLPSLTETAYLRSEIIRCRYKLDVAGVDYWIYFQGSTETKIDWEIKNNINFNELNMSGTIYIKNDERTRNYFHRFKKINIDGNTWQVSIADSITVPGILELEVKEAFNNTQEELPKVISEKEDNNNYIIGKTLVRQDGEYGYQIDSSKYIEDATWSILNNPRVKLIGTYLDGHTCKVKVEPGAVKNFTIRYGTNDDYIEQEIKIDVAPYLISGPQIVYPYETYTYTSSIGGVFTINNTKIAKIEKQDENSCTVKILTGKKNNFILSLELTEQDEELWGLLELPIEIKSY
jgi:hypothetical protein